MWSMIIGSPVWLYMAGSGALAGAALHIGVTLSGRADWVAYFRAPEVIVRSMRDGGLLGPVAGLMIGFLMLMAGLYAFSAAGVLPRLPLQRTSVIVLAVIGLGRGLLLVPLIMLRPALLTRLPTFDWVASGIWLSIGLCYAVGAWQLVGRRGE